MNIDIGATILLLASLALGSAPVVVTALTKIAHVHKEELKLRQEQSDEKPH